MKEVKDKGKDGRNGYDGNGEAVYQEDFGPATVPVAMPDFVLPPSFDSAFAVQITKDSSVCAKYGENGSTMAGFDIQNPTGLKIEDQIGVAKRLALVGAASAVRSGGDTVYGASFEVHLKSKDFPIEQDQSTLGLSSDEMEG
ncbi:hypothetical protein NC651_023587 [Populus alba x Populus x berolinensis]|nr:hypothetical protein NC651_023587 [Populus alba x Populus x berolinensis]